VIGSPFACISRLKAQEKGNKKCVGVFENEMEFETVSRILKNTKWNRATVRCDPWWRALYKNFEHLTQLDISSTVRIL